MTLTLDELRERAELVDLALRAGEVYHLPIKCSEAAHRCALSVATKARLAFKELLEEWPDSPENYDHATRRALLEELEDRDDKQED